MNSLAEGAPLLSELQVNLYLLVHNFGKTESNPKLTLHIEYQIFHSKYNFATLKALSYETFSSAMSHK